MGKEGKVKVFATSGIHKFTTRTVEILNVCKFLRSGVDALARGYAQNEDGDVVRAAALEGHSHQLGAGVGR